MKKGKKNCIKNDLIDLLGYKLSAATVYVGLMIEMHNIYP